MAQPVQPFNPLDFIGVADGLAAAGGEPGLRTAVGRAYYAAFLVARARTGVTTRGGKAHGEVHGRVTKIDWTTGKRLRQMYEYRTLADYDLFPEDPPKRDWLRNWETVRSLVDLVLKKL